MMTLRKQNVLVFPCGSEIGLEIYRSLNFSSDFELYGASSVNDHGRFTYKNYISDIPFVDDVTFIDSINRVVKKFNIDFIFPAHDSVVLKLAQNKRRIDAEIITSPLKTCEISRSKKKTYEMFESIINTPKVYEKTDHIEFPVFLKPDVGQGSKGTIEAYSYNEVERALSKDNSLLILENLTGKEYTIDCFTDKQGELLFAQARERARTMSGISVSSRPVKAPEFKRVAELINATLEFRGVWFFQLKGNKDNKLALLEVAPRVAGTMALCRMQGVSLPLLSLYDRLHIEVVVPRKLPYVEIDRALGARYNTDILYDNIYVYLEETLIVNGKVNTKLIAFLYESLNRKHINYLFVANPSNVNERLKRCKIDKDVFGEIFDSTDLVSQHQKKNKRAIIITDSYNELDNLYEELNLPIFNTSTIECLL